LDNLQCQFKVVDRCEHIQSDGHNTRVVGVSRRPGVSWSVR